MWPSVLAACADALNRAGEHGRAEALMLQALADWPAPDQRFAYQRIPLERQLALSEAGLARSQDAAARIDALLERYAGKDHPLLLGLLHKTRAEIALLCGDALGFEPAFEPSRSKMCKAHVLPRD